MATIRQKCFAKLKELNGTYEYHGPDHYYMFDAPKGFVWGASHGHCLVHFQYRGFGMKEFWEDVLERLSYGVYSCDESNCEVCEDE